jgi:SP family facilitated glucose transporter-like MFS transporter 8
MGEMFLPNVEGLAASLAQLLSAICGLILTKLFQVLTGDFGTDSPFSLSSAHSFISVVLIVCIYQEKKSKIFVEIYWIWINSNQKLITN